MSIPKLRFKGFLEDWNNQRLGDFAEFLKGKNISKGDIKTDGEIECIRYGELYTTYKEVIDIVISKTSLKPSELFFSKSNDIIIPSSGETAIDIATASCVLRDNIALGGDLNVIRTKENGVFLAYCLNSQKKLEIAKFAQGNSVVHLYSSQLKDLNIKLPVVKEQERIASFFTVIDQKINLLKEKKEKLELYKKGVMQQIFSQKLRFKDEREKEFPEWEEKRLGEICEYKNGGSFEKYVCEDGLYNLISLNSIDINGKIKSNHKKTSITDGSLQKGDLIMVLSDVAYGNFLGLTDIVPGDNFVLNQRMAALKLKITVDRFYLKTFINRNQSYFKLMGQGSSQLNLSKGDVENFIIKLPSLPEQQKIANFLSALDTKIKLVSTQIEKTELWKKGLLQQMFV